MSEAQSTPLDSSPSPHSILNRIRAYEAEAPAHIFEWHDTENTGASGIVVLNSLRGGAAGGGTRMKQWESLNEAKLEVSDLAKTMEIKFSVSGPAIGGAKAGINFDPLDSRKLEVIERFYTAMKPHLLTKWGTGGDLNVLPGEASSILKKIGIIHSQCGILKGHLKLDDAELTKRLNSMNGSLQSPVLDTQLAAKDDGSFTIADLATGYGVYQSLAHYASCAGETLKGKRIAIQGWGNVATGAAFYLTKAGAMVVGILDKDAGLLNEKGFDHNVVCELILNRQRTTLQSSKMITGDAKDKFWDIPADIFIPAAASHIVTKTQVERLKRNGVSIIACGANVPFFESAEDPCSIFGSNLTSIDDGIVVIPDFIANSGMASAYDHAMKSEKVLTPKEVFDGIEERIARGIREVWSKRDSSGFHFAKTAWGCALDKIGA